MALGVVEVKAVLAERGVLLESARGPIPNVAELIAGDPISGSWWAHPASHAIFAAINAVADSPDVVRLRLVNGKVTLVHRRVWPNTHSSSGEGRCRSAPPSPPDRQTSRPRYRLGTHPTTRKQLGLT
jgi:hypothetical protein